MQQLGYRSLLWLGGVLCRQRKLDSVIATRLETVLAQRLQAIPWLDPPIPEKSQTNGVGCLPWEMPLL